MRLHLRLLCAALLLLAASPLHAAPLRVFLRAGIKTHGPGQHDHPRFLGEYTQLLRERGVAVDGAMQFPSAQQLESTDVVVVFAADGMKITGQDREHFEAYLRRGGGLVVVHDGVVSGDQHEWAKKVQGGAWRWDLPQQKRTKWLETEVGLYFLDPGHPVTRGISNFDWKDEIYYDMDMAPDAKVLATSFHSVFIMAPQIWTYEKTWEGGSTPYRAFVSLPGHEYASFQTPHYRAILLRGIAWAGKRDNVDELCSPAELASLKYPAGGPTAPEQAAAKLNLHPEFNLNLVVAEPVVEKVMSLDWDQAGRLWVVETPEYPGGRTINRNDRMVAGWNVQDPRNIQPGDKEDRPARDRISWLEDTDGDGRYDRRHVFADKDHGVPGGLELATSLVLYKDGVIVGQAPDILWLRDTNGDGTADKVEKLYTGFGNFDTHAVINNFRWGLDGWVYCAVGYSAGSPRSAVTGREFGKITAGILRFKPDGSALEQVVSGSCNTWGFDFGPDGELFYTTATCGEHFLHIVMPDKVLARGNVGGVRGSAVAPDHQEIKPSIKHTRPAYVQIDWVGFFTAAAGSCIYNGGAWPDRWTGSHFTSETTMSLVHNEFLVPKGPTFVATKEPGREDTEFITGNDLWFRPIHTRVGPDGALYVVDFYNQAAIHNDTRGPAHGARNAATRPDRDHHFTRVWRVQHKQAIPLTKPRLDASNPAGLVEALKSPNGWTRDTAARLLRENGPGSETESLQRMAENTALPSATRIAALYTLAVTDPDAAGGPILKVLADPDPVLRRNSLRIIAEKDSYDSTPEAEPVRKLINDPDARVRLNALIALQSFQLSSDIARVVVEAWPKMDDKWTQSAAIGVAATEPALFVDAAFQSADNAALTDFVRHTVRTLANKQDATRAASLVQGIAHHPESTDALKQTVLETLGTTLKADVVPTWNDALAAAFKSFLASARPGLPGAALPLVARWDRDNTLAAELRPAIQSLRSKLSDASLNDGERGQVAVNLLGVRKLDASVIPDVAGLLGSPTVSSALQKRVAEAMGATSDTAAGQALVTSLPRLDAEVRETAFGQIIRRSDWTSALVQALADRKVETMLVGPANLHRLRTHSDKAVATKANEVIDMLKGPEQKQKDALIAKFKPEVERPGNLENGRKLYLANCAPCHKYKTDGADFAPNLTGMGAHGPADLLVHIVDPNRVVEPNFVAVSIETKDDLTYDGIVLRENAAAVFLRNQTAETEIRKDNIKSRVSTGRSLMPEGFEQLGGEGLRDLLAYLCADEQRFRILDLTPVFTANSSEGIYNSKESREESLRFRKFGTIKIGDIPFDITSPQKSPTGNNLLVLKGGAGISRSYPQLVEVKVGMPVRKLHILGGVGGWAWPYDGDRQKGLPAAKIIVQFAGGASEEIVLRNGIDIADYIARNDVPGSTLVPDYDKLLNNGRQLRWLSRPVQGTGVVESIAIASYNNVVAPTFVGITAEVGASPATGASTQPALTPASFPWGQGTRALLVGGGSSHDYGRWFNLADVETIRESGATAHYTEVTRGLDTVMNSVDVLVLSINRAFADDAAKRSVFAHADAGKGIVLLHAGLWYNWPDWPAYNRVLCGGGSRGHDRYGEFEVTVTDPAHPLMQGVPARFTLSDELYYFEPDPAGTPVRVLATAYSRQKGRTYPMVFVVEHPKARIAGITLGHDGVAHSHPAYKRLLLNSLDWVKAGGK